MNMNMNMKLMMNNKKMRFLALGAVSLAGVVFLFLYPTSPGHLKKKYQPVPLERGDLAVTIQSTGLVQSENRLEIKPTIAGRLEKVIVQEGQTVRKGQVLAWMSSTERAALLDAARARGPEELSKWQELYRPSPLLAPISGLIIARKVEPGQTINTTDPVIVMSDRLIIKAQVDETDIAQIEPRQKVAFTLDAYPMENLTGMVSSIAYDAQTVNNVTSYEVDVLPDTLPPFMKSGMTANVSFQVAAKKDVLLAPVESVQIKDGKSLILRAGSENERKSETELEVEVELGSTDGKWYEIKDGLKEGDVIQVPSFDKKSSSGKGKAGPFSPFGNRGKGGRP